MTISAPISGAYYQTANVPVGAFSVSDSSPYTVVQSGWAKSPDGSYTYTVTATDAAGNVGSASVTYTIDDAAPVVTITAPGVGPYTLLAIFRRSVTPLMILQRLWSV